MNLYLRLFWLILMHRFKPPITLSDGIERSMRVTPGDLDVNGHVNNGRYLTLVDLAVIEFFLRARLLFPALRRGWRPLAGGVMISYRRGLRPFERYRLRFRLQSWDERWNYFRFEFIRDADGRIAAVGYLKGALVGPRGWIANSDVDAEFDMRRPDSAPSLAVEHWMAAERALADEFSLAGSQTQPGRPPDPERQSSAPQA